MDSTSINAKAIASSRSDTKLSSYADLGIVGSIPRLILSQRRK